MLKFYQIFYQNDEQNTDFAINVPRDFQCAKEIITDSNPVHGLPLVIRA